MENQLKSEEIRNRLISILSTNPITRDDDLYLIWTYIESLFEDQKIERGFNRGFYNLSIAEFRDLFLSGRLGIPDSITRIRRLLQREFETLRGPYYGKRKDREVVIRSYMRSQGVNSEDPVLFQDHKPIKYNPKPEDPSQIKKGTRFKFGGRIFKKLTK